jgi:hypothetical protein
MSPDSSSELKAIAEQYIESLWRADIHRDFDDNIKFIDGEKHQVPRPQSEIDQIHEQIEHYASSLADALIERWNDAGIYTLADTRRDANTRITLIKICKSTFWHYREKVSNYVKSKQSSEK